MSLGLGIFLSSLILVSALIYRWTGDRWNWRRIGRWFAGAMALVVLAAAGLMLREWRSHRPKPQMEYYGVALGDSRDEVTYRLGMPTGVYVPKEADCTDPTRKPWCRWQKIIPLAEIPAGQTVHNYSEWFFEMKPRVTVRFGENGGVNSVECFWSAELDGALHRCHSILGLGTRTTEEAVISRLGAPQHVKLDGVVKTMRYPQFNVQLLLTKGEIYMLTVRDFHADQP